MKKKENEEQNYYIKDGNIMRLLISILIYTIFLGLAYFFDDKILTFIKLSNKDLVTSDVVVALLPFILTIISISLSLSDSKIFGISLNSFKRVRCNRNLNFKQQIYFVIFTFFAYTFSRYQEKQACIIVIDVFSIIYSIFFIYKDMPLLENNRKVLIKDVATLFEKQSKKSFKLDKDYIENQNELVIMLSYLTMNKGINNSYSELSKKLNQIQKGNLLETLISLNYFTVNKTDKDLHDFNGLVSKEKIKDIIEKSFDNIKYVIDFHDTIKKKNDFLIVDLDCKNLDKIGFYISKILFLLKDISLNVGLNNYDEQFLLILDDLEKNELLKNSNDESLFKIKILNNIIHDSVFQSDLYYLKLQSYDENSKKQLYFITTIDFVYQIYLFFIYLCGVNKIYPYKEIFDKCMTDKDLNSFISNEKDKQINYLINDISFEKIYCSLPLLLKIFKLNYAKFLLHGFYYDFMNCWIQFISIKFIKSNSTINFNELKSLNSMLEDRDNFYLSKILDNSWFNDFELKYNFDNEFIRIYDPKIDFLFKYKKNILSNFLFNYKNDFLKTKFFNIKIDENLKKLICNGFKENLCIADFYNPELECTNSGSFDEKNINLNKNSSFGFSLTKGLVFKFLKKQIYKNIEPTKDKTEIINKVDSISKKEKVIRTEDIAFLKRKRIIDESTLGQIYNANKISSIKMNDFLMCDKNEIQFNLELSEDDIEIEELSNEDIESVIKTEFTTKVNEFFKVEDHFQKYYVFLKEDELKKYIKNYYVNLKISYKYNFVVGSNVLLVKNYRNKLKNK